MQRICTLALISFVSFAVPVQERAGKPSTLQTAVEAFNKAARMNPVGKSQPKLTDAEVVAAILAWHPSPDTSKEVHRQILAIAESRELPTNAKLRFSTKLKSRGYDFTVWWIDLEIEAPPRMPSPETKVKINESFVRGGYTLRIRDQKISCKKASKKNVDADSYEAPFRSKGRG